MSQGESVPDGKQQVQRASGAGAWWSEAQKGLQRGGDPEQQQRGTVMPRFLAGAGALSLDYGQNVLLTTFLAICNLPS